MTKVKADKPEKAGDLGERIDALLDAMQSACNRVARQLNGEPEPVEELLVDQPAAEAPPIAPETPDPEAAVPSAQEPEPEEREDAEVIGAESPAPEGTQPSAEDEAFADDFGAGQFEEATPEQLGLDPAEPDASAAQQSGAEEAGIPEAADDPAGSAALDEQVGKMVDQAMVSAEDDPVAEGAIEDLDDELAALAEDLMNEGGSSFEAVEPDAAAESEPTPDTAPDPKAGATEAEPKPVAEEPKASEGEAIEAEVVVQATAAEPAKPKRSRIEWPEWKPVKSKEWKKIPSTAWHAVRLYAPPLAMLAWVGLGKASRAGEPWAIRALEASAKPLKGKPVEVRQAVGWSALVTLFSALVAWAFVLTREPPKPETDQKPIGLAQPAETPGDVPADAE